MKKLLFSYESLFTSILLIFLTSCISNDAGEDTDGPTKQGFPEVTTRTVIVSEEGVSAQCGGEVVSTGDSEIISRGICWSKIENPTIDDYITKSGNGIGDFTSDIENLEVNTRYYLRAYATNKFGTSYGGEVDFFTAKIHRGDVTLSSQAEVDAFGAKNYLTIIGDVLIGKTGGSDITNLKALNGLNQIRGDFYIGKWKKGNPLLKNLDGLEYLALIDSYYLNDYVPKRLSINFNDNLENIDALKGLGNFDGLLSISDNNKLQDIDAFINLTQLYDVHIFDNPSLKNLNGLSNITVTNGISLGSNPLISSLGNIKASSSIGAIIILNNNNLSDISSLEDVENIKYSFWLINNPNLKDVSNFKSLKTVGRTMELSGLGIINLNTFSSLTSVAKNYTPDSASDRPHLEISDNKSLNDLCGIKTLFKTDFKGGIVIKSNAYNPSKEDIVGDKCKKE